MEFVSPSKGKLLLEEVFYDISNYVKQRPNERYKLIIGTDSQVRDMTCFVTAIVIHRLGKGARYYYSKSYHKKIGSLRQKIYYETTLSLDVSHQLKNMLLISGLLEKVRIEVHVDIGNAGETRDLIREIVGVVMGSGFVARIKPDSFGASKVADRFTK